MGYDCGWATHLLRNTNNSSRLAQDDVAREWRSHALTVLGGGRDTNTRGIVLAAALQVGSKIVPAYCVGLVIGGPHAVARFGWLSDVHLCEGVVGVRGIRVSGSSV